MKNIKEWQKLFFGVTVIIVLLIVADRITGFVNQSLYNSSKYGIFGRLIYCLHESDEDILILGSSRASHHYVPSVFRDSLNLSCYNCGSDGMCIYFHYGILSSYIERGVRPKLVIYDVVNMDAEESVGSAFSLDAALDRFAPHYKEFKGVDSLFTLKSWEEKVKLLSKSYQYNSKLVQMIKCNYLPLEEDNGYEVKIGALPDTATFQVHKYVEAKIDSVKMKYINKLICLSKANSIPLIFVQSPLYSKTECIGINAIKEIAMKENIPFLDFANEKTLMKKEYFADESHLNDYGAHAWSEFLANKLKEMYQEKILDDTYSEVLDMN